jgi:hypothetical protein
MTLEFVWVFALCNYVVDPHTLYVSLVFDPSISVSKDGGVWLYLIIAFCPCFLELH